MSEKYSEQLLQFVFEEARAFRNSIRIESSNIPAKFDLLLVSLPKEIRDVVIEKMEQPLKQLQDQKNSYDTYVKNKAGYNCNDRSIEFYKYEVETYTPFISLVIDELDRIFRYQENSKYVDTKSKF